jgi:hypothetical protein
VLIVEKSPDLMTAHWINPQGRPTPIVTEGGRPIPELFA